MLVAESDDGPIGVSLDRVRRLVSGLPKADVACPRRRGDQGHHLSTVEIADRVLVVERGEIVEQGSPAQLLREDDGRYAALHEAWEASLV